MGRLGVLSRLNHVHVRHSLVHTALPAVAHTISFHTRGATQQAPNSQRDKVGYSNT